VTKYKIPKEVIENAILECKTMLGSAAKLNIQFKTFKRLALSYGIYKPNPGRAGITRKKTSKRNVQEALQGLHPTWPTYQLKIKLLEQNILKNQCSICGITEWLDRPIAIELDHIDGNRTNHKFENLRMLCPNCHSQTDTFRSRKRK
jgi:Zn finger protein HypA/HybF involved in hydrogenase expression